MANINKILYSKISDKHLSLVISISVANTETLSISHIQHTHQCSEMTNHSLEGPQPFKRL